MLGVEIIEEAINDAKFNAQENEIENSKFYAGNCDDYIHSLVYEAENENLLAVLDPPRAGIRKYHPILFEQNLGIFFILIDLFVSHRIQI